MEKEKTLWEQIKDFKDTRMAIYTDSVYKLTDDDEYITYGIKDNIKNISFNALAFKNDMFLIQVPKQQSERYIYISCNGVTKIKVNLVGRYIEVFNDTDNPTKTWIGIILKEFDDDISLATYEGNVFKYPIFNMKFNRNIEQDSYTATIECKAGPFNEFIPIYERINEGTLEYTVMHTTMILDKFKHKADSISLLFNSNESILFYNAKEDKLFNIEYLQNRFIRVDDGQKLYNFEYYDLIKDRDNYFVIKDNKVIVHKDKILFPSGFENEDIVERDYSKSIFKKYSVFFGLIMQAEQNSDKDQCKELIPEFEKIKEEIDKSEIFDKLPVGGILYIVNHMQLLFNTNFMKKSYAMIEKIKNEIEESKKD